MCSITGLVMPKNPTDDAVRSAKVHFVDTVCRAEDRGRDSWGAVSIGSAGGCFTRKRIGRPSEFMEELQEMIGCSTAMVLNNNRAEPTTEFVKEKSLNDVQPFMREGWVVAHNGTIANDKVLAEAFALRPKSKIDTAIIPELLKLFFGPGRFDTREVAKVITEQLVGSYALAIANVAFPDSLLLMTNYKPLYLAYHLEHGYCMFTSLEGYLQSQGLEGQLRSPLKVVQVPPYTAVHLKRGTAGVHIFDWSIKKAVEGKRALVVCSGGLDSTVCASLMKKRGYDVTLLHFRYSCRAEQREVEAVKSIGKRVDCDTMFVGTSIFKEVIGGSRLTGTLDAVATGESGAEFAHEWVPARNLIMLSIATGIAESKGFDYLVLGNNLEESGAYPDNEMEFINKLNAV
jgi:7-cyano-7-deazaguanine synthase